MSDNKVLVVEDDQTLLETLTYNLVKDGYEVVTATDGVEAIEIANTENPNIIILDIMLPRLDGFEVCRILRQDSSVPILMLTAKTEEIDRVVGLEIGADDYVTKPFSMRELMARIKSLLRRAESTKREASAIDSKNHSPITFADIEIDVDRHTVKRAGKPVELTAKEFDLLVLLVDGRGRVYTRDSILDKVWGFDYAGDTRTVDVHISWLRKKLEDNPTNPHHILTVRGTGYKFEE